MTRYELLDRIGVGGMAEIFRAKAVAAGGFEKPVAIKRILPHLSQDKRFVSLLIAEAKVLSQLRHRNIVQIFDVGLGDDGQYFLVMEFVDGTDLGAVQKTLESRRRRLPLDLVLHVGAEVCEALEHAHCAKAPDGAVMRLVHRDVSPSNVLLSRAGEVKLTDFGIAKRAEEHTGHGAVRGKFAYISPEQARNEPVDARSDVFSVGVLMYEMCLGKRLFSGLGDLEALRAVREVRVPRPTEADATLPKEVEAMLLSALARDPAQRPPSAGQLGARLRSIRYSLDEPAGDPATELGKIVENVGNQSVEGSAPAPAKPKQKSPFDSLEPTVLRIRTADEFQDSDSEGTAVKKARELLERFEEEETRMASIDAGDLARLRNVRDTGEEMTRAATPQAIFGHDTGEEATRFARPDRPELPEARAARLGKGKPARRDKPSTRPPPMPDGRRRDATPSPVDPLNEPTTMADADWAPRNPPPPPMSSRGAGPAGAAVMAQPSFGGMPLPGAPPLPAKTPPPVGAGFAGGLPPGTAFDARGRPVINPLLAIGPSAPSRGDRRTPMRDDPTGHRPHRASLPFVEGFARIDESRRTMLLVIGAVITGILGFAITRAIIGGDDGRRGGKPPPSPSPSQDAAAGPEVKPTKTSEGAGSGAAPAIVVTPITGGAGTGSATTAAPPSGSATAPAVAGSGSGSGAGSGSGSGSGPGSGSGSGSAVATKADREPKPVAAPVKPAAIAVKPAPKPAAKPVAKKPPAKPVKKPTPKPTPKPKKKSR